MKDFKIVLSAAFFMSFFGFTALNAQKSCPAPPPAFEKSSLVGEWSGAYTYEGQTYDLNMSIRLNGDQLSTTATLSGHDISNGTFTTWVCRSNDLHMRMDLPDNRAVKLIGYPENGALSGRFVYNAVQGTCTPAKESFSVTKTSSTIKME